MDAEYLDEFIGKVDLIQIGAMNVAKLRLVRKSAVKTTKKPILLKRGWVYLPRMDHVSRIYHGKWESLSSERVEHFESYTKYIRPSSGQ